jgi:hypothetical protein
MPLDTYVRDPVVDTWVRQNVLEFHLGDLGIGGGAPIARWWW